MLRQHQKGLAILDSHLKYHSQTPPASILFHRIQDRLKRLFSVKVDGMRRTLVEQILIDEMEEQEKIEQ